MSHALLDSFREHAKPLLDRRTALGALAAIVLAGGGVDPLEALAKNKKRKRRRRRKERRKLKPCKRDSQECKASQSAHCEAGFPGQADECIQELHACCGLLATCKYDQSFDCYSSSPWFIT